MVEERRVVLDTDFIFAIERYQNGDRADLFRRVFRVLNRIPVVHPYVADCELNQSDFARELIRQGDLTVIPYGEFLPDDHVEKEIYRQNFADIYRLIRDEQDPRRGQDKMPLLDPGEDIFARHARRSFGEIHSVLMATELGIPLFFSNDGGAKTAADYFGGGSLTVKNAEEVVKEIVRADKDALTRPEKRFLKNCRRWRQN